MNTEYTHISILLDRSGSMQKIKGDIIGGFNEFVEKQKTVEGKLTLTLVQFSTKSETVYDTVDISEVKPLTDETFSPVGNTALLDSLATLIKETGSKLAALPEAERPSKVLFTVITDGEENASRLYTKEHVADLITHQETAYKWEFIYLGANQDAFKVAGGLNMKGLNFHAKPESVVAMFAAYTTSTSSYRSSKKAGAKLDLSQADIDSKTKNPKKK